MTTRSSATSTTPCAPSCRRRSARRICWTPRGRTWSRSTKRSSPASRRATVGACPDRLPSPHRRHPAAVAPVAGHGLSGLPDDFRRHSQRSAAICARESFRRRLTRIPLCGSARSTPARRRSSAGCGKASSSVFQLIRDALADLESVRRLGDLEGDLAGDPGPSGVLRGRTTAPDPASRGVPRTRQPALSAGPRTGAGGRGVALNAHIDTVAPFFRPASSGDVISGRGAADDKGNVAVILGALQVLAELEQRRAGGAQEQAHRACS